MINLWIVSIFSNAMRLTMDKPNHPNHPDKIEILGQDLDPKSLFANYCFDTNTSTLKIPAILSCGNKSVMCNLEYFIDYRNKVCTPLYSESDLMKHFEEPPPKIRAYKYKKPRARKPPDKEKHAKHMRKYYETHREQIKAYRRNYYLENKEQEKAKNLNRYHDKKENK